MIIRVLAGLVAVQASLEPPRANTRQGIVEGEWFNYGYLSAVFKGIPYAKPPVGDLRFAPPQAADPFPSGRLQATEYGPGCPQQCHLQHPEFSCASQMSEDCLYLNVFVPSVAFNSTPPSKLPVLLWLHGGNYIQGAGGVDIYHGSQWAVSQMVVLVTINYRLGALGGLATAQGIRGNFQLQDQRLAMTWVRDNIGSFGGDPSRVCLFGQSAGGWSVGTHLSSPKSWGLFSSAIMMSNPTGLPSEDYTHLYQLSGQVVARVNCTGPSELSCLRSKTWQQILDAQQASKPPPLPWEMLDLFMPWTPVVDGDELPMSPLKASQTGGFAQVPILLGSMANDTLMFIFEAFTKPVPKVEYLVAIEAIFGPKYGTEILKLYGPPPDNQTQAGDVRPFLSALANDYIFYCSNRYFATGYSKTVPTYKYVFEHLPSYEVFFEHDWYPECDNYTCHGSELPMMFNTIYMVPEPDVPTLSKDEIVLSAQMQTIWANFAKSGDPNKPSAIPSQVGQPPVVVPRFSNVTLLDLRLDVPTSTFDHHRSSFCQYFDSIGYDRR